jgi:hypothetical protein
MSGKGCQDLPLRMIPRRNGRATSTPGVIQIRRENNWTAFEMRETLQWEIQ